MRSSRSRIAVLTAAGALGASTLAVTSTSSADTAGSTPTVHVFITKTSHVRMPTTLRPGTLRYVVRSNKSVAFQIVRVRPGYSKRQLAHDVNAGLIAQNANVHAIRRFERNVTLLGGVSARSGHPGVMFADLTPGRRYMAVDTNPPHFFASKLLTFHVAGSSVGGSVPTGSATLRAIHEMTWAKRPATIPSSGLLRFKNQATDNHFVVMQRFKPGKGVADWRVFARKIRHGKNPGPSPVFDRGGLFSGVQSPGHEFTFKYHLRPGRYLLTCFWPDADKGGLPHAFLGMFRGIRVTS
ncbi:MAG: hypothetical protein ACXVW9_16935 [Nocardioidaceae bacterium]